MKNFTQPVESTIQKKKNPNVINIILFTFTLACRHSITDEGCELLVSIVEARDLLIPQDADPDSIDTFVRVYLVPDEAEAMQTKIFRNSSNPSYQESFLFFITKQNIKRSLWFHLYHTNAHCTTLIGMKIQFWSLVVTLWPFFSYSQGETELKLTEFTKPRTTWVQLSDSRNNCTNCGDLMFSLSYLPTAERLTVIVIKARNLRPTNDENENHTTNESDIQNVYVKVCEAAFIIKYICCWYSHIHVRMWQAVCNTWGFSLKATLSMNIVQLKSDSEA